MTRRVAYVHPRLGRLYVPQALVRAVSLPGQRTRRPEAGEFGIFVATQCRPVWRDGEEGGVLERMRLLWHSISHNERVNQGALRQDVALFGTGALAFNVIAVANATLTKSAADLQMGSAAAPISPAPNEWPGSGLARVVGTLGTYTAPAVLGGTFSRTITKQFTYSAASAGTAYGAALFDSVTLTSANMYVEDNFQTNAALNNGDTLTVNVTITN